MWLRRVLNMNSPPRARLWTVATVLAVPTTIAGNRCRYRPASARHIGAHAASGGKQYIPGVGPKNGDAMQV